MWRPFDRPKCLESVSHYARHKSRRAAARVVSVAVGFKLRSIRGERGAEPVEGSVLSLSVTPDPVGDHLFWTSGIEYAVGKRRISPDAGGKNLGAIQFLVSRGIGFGQN